MKSFEPDAILTPATKISSRPIEPAKKLASLFKTAPRSSSHRVKSNEQKEEELDMESVDVYSINQVDPTAKINITEIIQSMKRGKRSGRQRIKSSAPWAEQFGFLNSSRAVTARWKNKGVRSKKMKRTRRGSKSWRVNTRATKGKKNVVGGEENSSKQSIPAEAVNSDNSRAESAEEPLCADSMASCIEFAVKILKDEIPLPAEVSEIEDLLKQMMCRQKSRVCRPSQSFLE